MDVRKLLDYFLPCCCEFCGRYDFFSSKVGVCKSCHNENRDVRFVSDRSCKLCNERLVGEEECPYCVSRNVFFEELKFLRNRTEFMAKTINRIKFESAYSLSIYLCLGMKRELRSWKGIRFSAIVRLPSYRAPWYKPGGERAFSSCDFAIRRLRSILPFPITEPVEKISPEKQAGKGFAERFFHAGISFRVKETFRNRLSGNYLLLDDVFTTGASANEVAKILLQNGAASVRVLTLIRTEGKNRNSSH
ncbi:ComF family protein [Leptospira gomenensis]|uniref:ComF family protein n=1 Tax=Leptospira gomenensis TaxID=2484974 RepID=A0A5F1YFR8_9LEPT|nr:ComF family protein [Leptospira gomenensis]TGK39242.1 ComF family protein [Leptospira gomenensis]TGK42544.1 ComF family protein [Leptospira gomenensis]TGK48912.1 ComF family protein [Leptospira gomenensis]TGK54622.1 ComF family protein [Leptospira gomenensis]